MIADIGKKYWMTSGTFIVYTEVGSKPLLCFLFEQGKSWKSREEDLFNDQQKSFE